MAERIETIIIGGTFNPVHNGHMHLAEEALKQFNAERIILVPAYIPAHKDNSEIISSVHRIKMLEIACRNPEMIIETCEIDRGGISYSIDTIRYIKKEYRLAKKPGLLIGDDLASGFPNWRKPEEIISEAEIIIAGRNFPEGVNFLYNFHKLENHFLDISSSGIRERLREGRACRYLMPSGVYEYIKENKLYGEH